MKFVRYDSYKYSDVDWFDTIPKEWSVTHLKRLSKNITDGAHTSPDTSSNDYPFLSVVDLKDNKLDFENCLFTSKGDYEKLLRNGCKPKLNDVLFSKDGTIGETFVIQEDKEFVVGSSFIIISPNTKKINPSFLNYLLSSPIMKYQSRSNVKGIGLPRISIFNTSKMIITYPDKINEQIEISNYLDIKTQKIDSEISILEQKIEKYKELKQTLIAETVLIGLDKNVELKDSEIEWIGNIPKYWEVKRLKDFIKFTIGGEVIDVSYWNDGTELTYTAGKNPVLSTFNNFPDRKRTKQNDILIARNGDGFIHVPKLNSIFTNVVQLVRLSKKVDVKFIFYALENIKYHINKTSNGDFIASLNKDMWFNSFIITPKYEEQVEIANYLDKKTSKIDSIIEVIGKKIEVLKEFRKTLINDVVTGKVKVA
ncbi:restriction endonuclease subunit S [Aliarcobacter butzleri]|uniref:Restriction endonuclease subunit S n=1 Tax=Aliarcobacter butzleri TaxID=28197 RepID=A0AAW7PUA9_9BACT|nr:restriction endonuclease subunit S [Aliarcobacter butzleri]MDN5069473.1 restriction endonuclease subunit S [Aliarcobacter butzleri]